MPDNSSNTQRDLILKFWFQEIKPEQWWRDQDLDLEIKKRFLDVYNQLSLCVPENWKREAKCFLAAILVLDQFPRNIFRNDPKAFATDARALALSKEAIAQGFDQDLTKNERIFLYIPFQHSENIQDQEQSIILFSALDDEFILSFAKQHKDVIDRFGRYPHRNRILGRQSTEEELEFLKQPGSFW